MKILRNLPFGLWFYSYLEKLRPLRRQIRQYRAAGDDEGERRLIRQAEDIWGDALMKRMGITLRVQVDAPLPDGPVVFVSNHQSYVDIPVFFAAIKEKQFGFVAKAELIKIPGFGSWIADVRSLFIERTDARAALKIFDEGAEMLHRGFSLVIFPEGTRSRGSAPGEFKKGSLRLASKAGVPIVPVTLNGTWRVYEDKGYLQPATVDFVIHAPIETASLSKAETGKLSERVERIILDRLAVLAEHPLRDPKRADS